LLNVRTLIFLRGFEYRSTAARARKREDLCGVKRMRDTARSLTIMAAGLAAQSASATAGDAESVPFRNQDVIDLALRQKSNVYGIITNELKLLMLLLVVDASIMLAYLMSHKFLSNAFIFDIDRDFTIPSLYQYALLGGSALCMYRIYQKEAVYRPWAYLLAFLFIDDVISVHENVGKFLGQNIVRQNIWLFTKRSLGESIFTSVLAVLFLYSITRSYFRAATFDRKIFQMLTVTLAILAVFGLLFDIAHDYYRKVDEDIAFWTGFFEDVGEIFTSSVLFWVCYNVYRCYAFEHRSPETVATSFGGGSNLPSPIGPWG
jgi:hypothetical protein